MIIPAVYRYIRPRATTNTNTDGSGDSGLKITPSIIGFSLAALLTISLLTWLLIRYLRKRARTKRANQQQRQIGAAFVVDKGVRREKEDHVGWTDGGVFSSK
jgi:membrane protein implicated in regulation of membrane protease activity